MPAIADVLPGGRYDDDNGEDGANAISRELILFDVIDE